MASEKDSIEKLMVYQQDLQAEEECLKQIIAKLNAQAHALQVGIAKFLFVLLLKLLFFHRSIIENFRKVSYQLH